MLNLEQIEKVKEVVMISKLSCFKLLAVVILLLFSALIFTVAQTTSSHSQKSQTADTVPSALSFTINLSWKQFYTGDPLLVAACIESPRTRQENYRQLYELENEITPTPSNFSMPSISSDWASTVNLSLYKLGSKGTKELIISGNWLDYQIGSKKLIVQSTASTNWQEWMLPADVAHLSEGNYILEAIWNGKNKVEASIIGLKGELKASSIAFKVKSPISSYENGLHLQRMACAAYLRNDFQNAIKYEQDALSRLNGELSQEIMAGYFILANAQIELKDYHAALATYRELFNKLPDPETEQADLIKDRITELEKLIGKNGKIQ